ncbi:MAG TPA: hydantoinase B/oxoprolinase family protein, partial [Beijerinckiaceae bacterium]|nr:hydantoinase B/oxoprolinase family protein [Beijerinckiaceae bacterium]
GLQIPIVKYQKAGIVNQDLVDIIRINVRVPQRAMGDLRAQIIAVKTGERRFLELVRRYGRAPTFAAIANIMDQSEKAARARTLAIPDGVYEAESFMDDDGVEIGARVPIKVRVTVAGDTMTIDLTEVSKQVRGFYNSGETTGYACAQVAYKCMTSPKDYPINEGSFRSLNVVLAPGTIVSAIKPAPMRSWMTFPMTIVDTIFMALEPAVPGDIIAGHHADLMSANIHGFQPKTGTFFIGSFGPLGGGWGAKMTEDGISATVCMNDGDTHNSPVEQVEMKYPILVEDLGLREGSGGAGRTRGGLGIERTVMARAPLTFNSRIDRMHCAPWGLAGGGAGAGNEVALRIDGAEIADLPNAKVYSRRLKAGDAFVVRSGGGGGFGPPTLRAPERVASDVREGYVSRECARDEYGVVLGDDGQVDAAATEALRRRMRG